MTDIATISPSVTEDSYGHCGSYCIRIDWHRWCWRGEAEHPGFQESKLGDIVLPF
jgi:hypothetical protein